MPNELASKIERVRDLVDAGDSPAEVALKLGGLKHRRVQQLLKLAGRSRRVGRPQVHPPRHMRISYRAAGAA